MPKLDEATVAVDLDKIIDYLATGDDKNDMTEVVTSKGGVYSRNTMVGDFGRQMTPLHLEAPK